MGAPYIYDISRLRVNPDKWSSSVPKKLKYINSPETRLEILIFRFISRERKRILNKDLHIQLCDVGDNGGSL